MDKKNIIFSTSIFLLLIISIFIVKSFQKESTTTQTIEGTVLSNSNAKLTVQDKDNIIYTFNYNDKTIQNGSNIAIEYTGLIDRNKSTHDVKIVNYTTREALRDENGILLEWLDNGIFSDYYIQANNKLKELTLDEKIGQLFLVRYPETSAITDLQKFNFGGYVFFEKDFKDKTKEEVIDMTNNLQSAAKIPILTAVDEEGGKVVRISSNPNLALEKFKSPSELYNLGDFDLIKEDTIKKSKLLSDLGLNLNLAPVVDVTTDPNAYMYKRTLQQNTELTSTFAKTVIEASKGTGVSYTLKHFPGYGNNADTHLGGAVDTRTFDELKENDLPPFESGIKALAEAILVSHNIVSGIDSSSPASISADAHNLLRNELKFTGIVITDDISMGAVSSITDVVPQAILAGNDMIITTDYVSSINAVKEAINNEILSQEQIDKIAFRVLAWKYYKGLMIENQK